MAEGELKKQIYTAASFIVPFPLTDEENFKVNEILTQIVRNSNAIRDKALDVAAKEFREFNVLSNPIEQAGFLVDLPEIRSDHPEIFAFIKGVSVWYQKWFGSAPP